MKNSEINESNNKSYYEFKEEFDFFLFGNLSKDIIETPYEKITMTGGAVLHASWTLHQLGAKIGVLTKTAPSDRDLINDFPRERTTVYWLPSKHTTSIRNYYPTKDKERRICTNLGEADLYKIEDFPDVSAKVWMYSALMTGETTLDLLVDISNKGKLTVDAQGMLRTVQKNGEMIFEPWDDIDEILPYVTYFKADAAEAEFITGINTEQREGRIEAAKILLKKGAKEVLISHNTEILALSNEGIFIEPYKNRSLDGRTGRGDTTTAAYVFERQRHEIKEAVRFAAALVSLKMEIPGPFHQEIKDVNDFLNDYY